MAQGEKAADAEVKKEPKERMTYSEKYHDDLYEYRHIILPKWHFAKIPKTYFNKETGTLNLLTEDQWRALGIAQSIGWEHYEVHAPEPHVLLFRRRLDFDLLIQLQPEPLPDRLPARRRK